MRTVALACGSISIHLINLEAEAVEKYEKRDAAVDHGNHQDEIPVLVYGYFVKVYLWRNSPVGENISPEVGQMCKNECKQVTHPCVILYQTIKIDR